MFTVARSSLFIYLFIIHFLQITFEEFVKYYEFKKEKRRSMIEQEIMDEFEAIEKMFGFGEGFNVCISPMMKFIRIN